MKRLLSWLFFRTRVIPPNNQSLPDLYPIYISIQYIFPKVNITKICKRAGISPPVVIYISFSFSFSLVYTGIIFASFVCSTACPIGIHFTPVFSSSLARSRLPSSTSKYSRRRGEDGSRRRLRVGSGSPPARSLSRKCRLREVSCF